MTECKLRNRAGKRQILKLNLGYFKVSVMCHGIVISKHKNLGTDASLSL